MRNTALLGTRLVAVGLLTKMLTAKPASAAAAAVASQPEPASAAVASQPEPAAEPLPDKAPQ